MDAEPFVTDCLIVGAGPGGLIAATYLGRFRRPPLVVDGGNSRAAWIPTSHNIPGFPEGLSGSEFLARLHAQAERYGARMMKGRVDRLQRRSDGRFSATGPGIVALARRVIIATGVDDEVPDMAVVARGIRAGRVRLCPVCDGYEVSDHRVGVIGPPTRAAAEARFVTAFTGDVTVMRLAGQPAPDAGDLARCAEDGIAVASAPLARLESGDDGIAAVLEDGSRLDFDDVYVAMGGRPRAGLARRLGARTAPDGYLDTDRHQRTTIPGVYAVGDVVHELNQIAVAAGHAAIAATDAHNGLSLEERGEPAPWPSADARRG